MTWLVESIWPAITLGVVLEVALGIALVRSGRGAFVVAMALVLLATLGLIALEWSIVTETEEVEDTLASAAAALESSDPASVLEFFSENSPRRAEVERALERFHVREARVGGDLRITTNALTSPPSATATLTGRLNAADQRREIPYENVVRRFKITLHDAGDRWLIHDVQMAAQQGGEWSTAGIRPR
jgi:hypothetical protein